MQTTFLSIFADPVSAERNLVRIKQNVDPQYLRFMERLESELRQQPEPDRILNYFERLSVSVINKTSFLKMLCDFPPIVARLCKLFEASPFLSEIIIRDFQFTYFLLSPELHCKKTEPVVLQKDISVILNNQHYSTNRKFEALRIFRRRALLMIGIRDYILNTPLEETVASISMLADHLIHAVYEQCYQSLEEKYGKPGCTGAVIGLGKLGGNELNYSSDIDLMFVYKEEGQTSASAYSCTHHEFFNQLAEMTARVLSQKTQEGQLYRVDTRLRPDGDAGPIARSVASYFTYYESRGQLWERQMLIKARPVAADREFGQNFINQLRPFVYPATFFQSPLKEIARMKWRIEEQKQTGDILNIKICPGGIRDIEFIVQALQLLNGGRLADIRCGNTLQSIDKLLRHNLISEQESSLLRQSYIFYRKIEHLLQIEHDRQTHTLSHEDADLERMAHLLEFKNRKSFVESLDDTRRSVRSMYDNFFKNHQTEPADPLTTLFDSEKLETSESHYLKTAGFDMPETAFRTLKNLAFGHFPKMYGNTTREIFLKLSKPLLHSAAGTPNPLHTLVNFERIAAHYPAIEGLYKLLLDDRELLNALIILASYTNNLTNVLCEDPAHIDYLISHLRDWIQLPQSAVLYDGRNLYTFKNLEWLRLALQEEKNALTQKTVFWQLSEIADTTLQCVFKKYFPDEPIALIGLGKLGGLELSYRSDLDVVFVCDDQFNVDDAIACSKKFLNEIAQTTPQGKLYEIDARLRPEGNQAPLVVTLSRYRDYLQTRAMFWEIQALIKARPVAGDRGFAEKVIEMFHSFAYDRPFTSNDAQSIIDMRRRQVGEKIKKPEDAIYDIKFSSGGLLDIEYVVQAYQMKFAQHFPSLKATNTLEALAAMMQENILSEHAATGMASNYHFLRSLEKTSFLAFERKASRLPNDEKQLAFLSKFLKLQSVAHLIDRLNSVKKENEVFFSSLMLELHHE